MRESVDVRVSMSPCGCVAVSCFAPAMPLLLLVESGLVNHDPATSDSGDGASALSAPTATATAAAPLSASASGPLAALAVQLTSAGASGAALVRNYATCGRAAGHDRSVGRKRGALFSNALVSQTPRSLLGCELFAPRVVGSTTPSDPIRYTAAADDVVVAVQTKEQLLGILRADGDLAARFYRVVCTRINHLLQVGALCCAVFVVQCVPLSTSFVWRLTRCDAQHIPAPSNAEQLAMAMVDANLAKRSVAGSGCGVQIGRALHVSHFRIAT